MNWNLLWMQVWRSPVSFSFLHTHSHSHFPSLSDGKLHPLLWSPTLLSIVLRQTVICSTVFVYCICFRYIMAPFTAPLLLELIFFCLKWSLGKWDRQDICLFIFASLYVYHLASQSTWAEGKKREDKRVLRLSVRSVYVSFCLWCAVCHFSVTCDRWVGWLAYLWTSRPHHRHTSWSIS